MAQRWRFTSEQHRVMRCNTLEASSPHLGTLCFELNKLFFFYQMEIVYGSLYFIQEGMEGSSWIYTPTAPPPLKLKKSTRRQAIINQASTKVLCDEKGQWRSYQNEVHKFNPLKGQIYSVIKAEKNALCYQKFSQWLKWSFDCDSKHTNKHNHKLTEQRSGRGHHACSNACHLISHTWPQQCDSYLHCKHRGQLGSSHHSCKVSMRNSPRGLILLHFCWSIERKLQAEGWAVWW